MDEYKYKLKIKYKKYKNSSRYLYWVYVKGIFFWHKLDYFYQQEDAEAYIQGFAERIKYDMEKFNQEKERLKQLKLKQKLIKNKTYISRA